VDARQPHHPDCLSDAERRELVTATNLCLPSEMFAWLERRRAPNDPITT
jgi:hypothetical protein